MKIVLRNLAAGTLGRALVAIIGLVCIPLTILILGVERYGIISLSATFLALSSILDLGVAPSLNRELARLAVIPGEAQRMRDLLRTFESFVWVVAAVLAGAAFAFAPAAAGWFRDTDIPPDDIRAAIALMGLAVAVQWPISLYSGGLIGLQEQVALNVVNVAAVALRSFGAVLVIWLVSPTMQAYLGWQILVLGGQTIVLALILRRHLPHAPSRPRVRFPLVRGLWHLALGMSGTTILMVLTSQCDKLILSRLLPLESFGYYMIAWSLAGRLGMLTDPVVDSVFPHMTELVSAGGASAVRSAYRTGVQLMSVIVLPMALTLALFAGDVSWIWTAGASYADQVAALLAPLVLGVACVSLLDVPMALQWAAGLARPVFVAKLIGVCLLVPGIAVLSSHYGVAVGAWAWPAINGALLIFALPVIHRAVFHGRQWWWWREVLTAALAITAVLLAWRAVDHAAATLSERLVRLGVASIAAATMGIATIPFGRAALGRLRAGAVIRFARKSS